MVHRRGTLTRTCTRYISSHGLCVRSRLRWCRQTLRTDRRQTAAHPGQPHSRRRTVDVHRSKARDVTHTPCTSLSTFNTRCSSQPIKCTVNVPQSRQRTQTNANTDVNSPASSILPTHLTSTLENGSIVRSRLLGFGLVLYQAEFLQDSQT